MIREKIRERSEKIREKSERNLSDEGPMLETLDYTIRIGSTPSIKYSRDKIPLNVPYLISQITAVFLD